MTRRIFAPLIAALVCTLLAFGCAVKHDRGLHKGQYKQDLKGKR